jgi:NhaP-type Na+/H+ or K+/H+ antiporter
LTGSPGKAIGTLFLDNLIGLAAGIVFGCISYFFNFLKKYPTLNMYMKSVYCMGCAILFVLVGEEIKYTNSKYIAGLTFGYVSYRMWGEDKPTAELGWVWFFITPLFFGSVGATLILSKIKSYFLGYGAVCIFVGLFVRIIAVLLISLTKDYTNKERMFMAVSWLPKATV